MSPHITKVNEHISIKNLENYRVTIYRFEKYNFTLKKPRGQGSIHYLAFIKIIT